MATTPSQKDAPHTHSDPQHDPAATAKAASDPHAPTPAPAPPAPPAKPKPRTFKTFGGKGEAVLTIRHTAGGDTDFQVISVVNSVELQPGMILSEDEVKGLGGSGFEAKIFARLADNAETV